MPPGGAPARLEVAIKEKAYGERAALGSLSFILEPGEVGAVVGPSGCGKTTLLRLVAGLDTDFRGRIAAGGAGLAVVFQEPRLLPWRSVEDNVRLVAPNADRLELAVLLARLGLEDHARDFPSTLSLGLARRVAIARALAVKPALLLLDEPFASLDGATAQRLADTLVPIFEAKAATTLLVSHDLVAAARLGDHALVLSERPGRLVKAVGFPQPRPARTPEIIARYIAELSAPQPPQGA